ncbi:MAG: hypothetical protein K8I27_09955 [Planctomycetes bacterium]|nr:hypothetical protein [Planctomycetota bacterium]
MRKAILFCALAVACFLVACGADNTSSGNDGTDVAPMPPSWDNQTDRDWLYRNQYKQHMRHLWIDCNRVVSAGRGDLEPTWVEIIGAAADVQRRASIMGGFWSDIVAAGEEIEYCLDDQDRMGTAAEFTKLGAACDGCHMATWSPAYLHVTNGTVDGWLNNRVTKHNVNEQDNNPPPTLPNREAMKKLFFHYSMAQMRLEQWQPEDMKTSIGKILEEARVRSERWGTVATEAGKIVELANARKREGMKEAYGVMTEACLTCHGLQAGAAREILIPMPWDGPTD